MIRDCLLMVRAGRYLEGRIADAPFFLVQEVFCQVTELKRTGIIIFTDMVEKFYKKDCGVLPSKT